jgi:Na+-transporting NADH:ubiquinone oxidoreductase subunit NqrA
MNLTEKTINKISQDKIDFSLGIKLLLEDEKYNFDELFTTLRNYIFNSIPNKTDYNSEAYQNAINTIPLKPTYTPIVILKSYSTKIAFNKLVELPKSENKKTITSLVWIFKITDTERRNTECKNGCGHYWHSTD